MNSSLKLIAISILTTLMLNYAVAGNGPGQGAGNGSGQGTSGHSSSNSTTSTCPSFSTTTPLTVEEVASLRFMREEEKLARDVYQTLAVKWQVQVFDNIMSSEQTHMDQLKCVFDAYQLPDSASTEVGQFNDAKLQSLYQDLTTRGMTSLPEALRVGALIEEVDIQDLNQALTVIQQPEMRVIYQNLLEGSYNHLRGFVRNLEQQGEGYTAQILSNSEVTSILTVSGTAIPVFDLDSSRLLISEMQLRKQGSIVPSETYQVELHLNPDGKTLQIINLKRLQ